MSFCVHVWFIYFGGFGFYILLSSVKLVSYGAEEDQWLSDIFEPVSRQRFIRLCTISLN